MSDRTDVTRSRSRPESLLATASQPRARWPEMGAILGLLLVVGLRAGPPGVLAGSGTIVVWYALGTPYALAIGHLLLVPLFPAGIDPVSLALVEAGFLALLVAPAVRTRSPVGVATVTVGTAVSVAGLAWLALRWHPLWVAAATTVGLLALAHYGLYRYALVSLGLVDDDPTRDVTADSDEL
ncbi:hypothetical protein [Halosolutus halophilus]|uniref:hypothetical protein n=1 Tax=Halosolutus halophilus TaxID=1552990 RepID=UPI002235283A|nr:hypothetical protein [Halosolutus halophilus]